MIHNIDIKPLPVSEEMLGAYLEGNLNPEEASIVENLISEDFDFKDFVDDISLDEIDTGMSIYDENSSFEIDFSLPELFINLDNLPESHIFPFAVEPSFTEMVACAAMSDVLDDGNFSENSTDNDVLNLIFDNTSSDASIDNIDDMAELFDSEL